MAEKQNFPVVGIGSSAGGLEALRSFFANVPQDCEAAFLVVQHLGKSFASNLDKLLAKVTDRTIKLAVNGHKIEPGVIYLQPRGHTITFKQDRIELNEIQDGPTLQFPVNTLFESIALAENRRVAAVVLSGTGSDGARALSRLQESGALTVAQDIDSAEFGGMPQTAINTDHIDLVMPPEDMGKAIQKFITREQGLALTPEEIQQSHLQRIYTLLRVQSGIDFEVYKPSTLLRRIDRRMAIQQDDSLREYAKRVNHNRDELIALNRDLLIGVTSFFRDTESFEALDKVIRRAYKTSGPTKRKSESG